MAPPLADTVLLIIDILPTVTVHLTNFEAKNGVLLVVSIDMEHDKLSVTKEIVLSSTIEELKISHLYVIGVVLFVIMRLPLLSLIPMLKKDTQPLICPYEHL